MVAFRRRRKLYREAHFRGFGPLLQVKRGPRTDFDYKSSSKIILWMIFDSTSLNLVLAEPDCGSPTAQRRAVGTSHLHKCVQMRTDVRQPQTGTDTSIDFYIFVRCHRGFTPVPP